LSDRSREGNTDAPRVDTDYGERSGRVHDNDTSRGAEGSGIHSVREGHSDRDSGRRGERGDRTQGTSWVSVIIGWLTALGASLILTGIVGAVVGAILGGGQPAGQEAQSGGISGLIGLLLTLLLAFLIGGYAAGRMASRSGLKHGILVPVLALAITIILAGIGALLGLSFIDQLSGVTLPSVPRGATQNLGTILTVSGILALLAPFIGGALGGLWGARTGSHRP
jgi:hypothetical protein